jgi:hypothetical protein
MRIPPDILIQVIELARDKGTLRSVEDDIVRAILATGHGAAVLDEIDPILTQACADLRPALFDQMLKLVRERAA